MSADLSGSASGDGDILDGNEEMDHLKTLTSATLAVALVSIVFTLIMTALMFYFFFKLKREVHSLRTGKGGDYSRTERGDSPSYVTKTQGSAKELEHQIECVNPISLPPPPSPGVPQQAQNAPSPPSSPVYDNVKTKEQYEATSAQQSPPYKQGYADVTLGEGVLPPELRTVENLQGHSLTAEQVLTLEENERKEAIKYQYEETKIRERREEELVASVRKMAKDSKQQGKEKDDFYFNPADAIPEDEKIRIMVAGKKSEREEGKKLSVQTPQNSNATKEKYSLVFDCLPAGEKKVIKPKDKCGKTQSDTSPQLQRKPETNTVTMAMPTGAISYEDIPEDHFKSRTLPHTSPVLRGGGGKNNVKAEKRYSHPARHSMAKEMVEVNPKSHKPVTMSSQRKKQPQQPAEAREDIDSGTPPVSKPAETSLSEDRSFAISSGSGASQEDCYALVNLAGKKRYRAESDADLKEGSGAPQHYTVKEKLLDLEIKGEDTIAAQA